jgi:hypothetical protein
VTRTASLTGAVRAVALRVGRRGAALLSWAFVDVIVGWSLLDPSTQPRGPAAAAAYRAILAIAPYPVWAWLWIAIAAVCVGGAFAQRDAIAFGAAIGIKLVWAGGLLVGWLAYNAYRGWVAAATWLVLASLVAVIAGWPEPSYNAPHPAMPSEREP